MVTEETRNNVIVVIVLIAIAILIAAFIYVFSNSLLQVAQHGENTVNTIGKSVAGNVSKSADINQMNLVQFNKSMTDVIASNDRIVHSNNASINNLTAMVHNFSASNSKYLYAVTNNTSVNKISLYGIMKELKKQTLLLQNISKKLDVVPVAPVVPTPINNSTGDQKCMIKTPTICILPNGGGIVIGTNHK